MRSIPELDEVVRDAEDRLIEIGLGCEVSVDGPEGRLTYKNNRKAGGWALHYGPEGRQRQLVGMCRKDLEAGIALIPALEARIVSEAVKLAVKINEIVDQAQEAIRKARESWSKRASGDPNPTENP